MRSKLIGSQILFVECETTKELVLSFFRTQECYESPHKKLRGHAFSIEEFLEVLVQDDGTFTYFTDWAGFNFPGDVYKKWIANIVPTKREILVFREIQEKVDYNRPFYVIAALKNDSATLDHELCHALFFLDKDYRKKVLKLIEELPEKVRQKAKKTLLSRGYDSSVVPDEIAAYFQDKEESVILENLGIDPKKHAKVIKKFRDLFEDTAKTLRK